MSLTNLLVTRSVPFRADAREVLALSQCEHIHRPIYTLARDPVV